MEEPRKPSVLQIDVTCGWHNCKEIRNRTQRKSFFKHSAITKSFSLTSRLNQEQQIIGHFSEQCAKQPLGAHTPPLQPTTQYLHTHCHCVVLVFRHRSQMRASHRHITTPTECSELFPRNGMFVHVNELQCAVSPFLLFFFSASTREKSDLKKSRWAVWATCWKRTFTFRIVWEVLENFKNPNSKELRCYGRSLRGKRCRTPSWIKGALCATIVCNGHSFDGL